MSSNQHQLLIARAPGKLILSGEHAVLYGQPALAGAVALHAFATFTPHATHSGIVPNIHLEALNLKVAKAMVTQGLEDLRHRLLKDYEDFLKGKVTIRGVLQKPIELFQFAVSQALRAIGPLKQGFDLRTYSQIPMGCGMGSSAATIVASLGVLNAWFDLGWDELTFLQKATETENLQHGRSSGLDVQVSLKGGFWWTEGGSRTPLARVDGLTRFKLWRVFTGLPASSTGECVETVARRFAQDQGLWSAFGHVTAQMRVALENGDEAAFKQMLHANQQLLERIQVVPGIVKEGLVQLRERAAAEGMQLACKVTGAGAIRGDRCGVVLLAGFEGDSTRLDSWVQAAFPSVDWWDTSPRVQAVAWDSEGFRCLA